MTNQTVKTPARRVYGVGSTGQIGRIEMWTFDKNYHNLAQIEPFWDAYKRRYAEIVADGEYPYNASFVGHIGFEPGHSDGKSAPEDTAIYLCQKRRYNEEWTAKVTAKRAEGFREFVGPVNEGEKPRFARVALVDNQSHRWQEWENARVVNGIIGLAVLPFRARTLGYQGLGCKVMVSA